MTAQTMDTSTTDSAANDGRTKDYLVGKPNKRSVKYALEHGIKIGVGVYREVYKTKRSNWVYKIDIDSSEAYGNYDEYKTYLEIQNLPAINGIRVPEMHYIDGVVVAEFIQGEHPGTSCYFDFHVSECTDRKNCWINRVTGWAANINDLHADNVLITNDGTIYIIDLGFGLS